MTHRRGPHFKGLFAFINQMHAPSLPKAGTQKVCYCNKRQLGLHSVNCAERLKEFVDTSHSILFLRSCWDMGWNLEEIPSSFTLKSKPGLAFTMGRDYRAYHIEEHPIPEVDLSPAVFATA
jgi:hypothetical protein